MYRKWNHIRIDIHYSMIYDVVAFIKEQLNDLFEEDRLKIEVDRFSELTLKIYSIEDGIKISLQLIAIPTKFETLEIAKMRVLETVVQDSDFSHVKLNFARSQYRICASI